MSSDPWVQVPIRLHSSKCIYWIQNVFCIQWGWLSIWTYVHFLRKHVCSCLMDRRRGSTKILGENMVNNTLAATAAVKSLQSCPTLCNPRDCSPPGSPVPGILQARTLEWVAISFSNAWKWKVKGKSLSHARLLATPWIAAHQAPPSMGFSRQEYWSGVPLPSPLF